MRPRPGVTGHDLLPLIEEQATTFQSLPQFWDVEAKDFLDRATLDEAQRLYLDRYRHSSQALAALLDIDWTPSPHDHVVSWRVYALTWNRLIPPEWRLHAHRTYLPDELPGYLATWRSYLDAVRCGHHHPYLCRLHRYHLSLQLYDGWNELSTIAAMSRHETAAWAHKPALVEVCGQIRTMDPPALYPAPVWHQWRHRDTDSLKEQEETDAVLQQGVRHLVELTRAWDRHVKGRWKIRRYQGHYLATFEQFVALANDEWVRSFLTWVEHCCAESKGLFLDY